MAAGAGEPPAARLRLRLPGRQLLGPDTLRTRPRPHPPAAARHLSGMRGGELRPAKTRRATQSLPLGSYLDAYLSASFPPAYLSRSVVPRTPSCSSSRLCDLRPGSARRPCLPWPRSRPDTRGLGGGGGGGVWRGAGQDNLFFVMRDQTSSVSLITHGEQGRTTSSSC